MVLQRQRTPERLLVYISGPITGLPDNNYYEFMHAQERINAAGLDCLVPHEFFTHIDTVGFKHDDYMRVCIAEMMKADIIVTLKDWELSKGAKMEVNIAREMQMPVKHIVAFLAEHGIKM
jgi:hypothetical protein